MKNWLIQLTKKNTPLVKEFLTKKEKYSFTSRLWSEGAYYGIIKNREISTFSLPDNENEYELLNDKQFLNIINPINNNYELY